ncbi:MAG: hypothetical protein Tsb0014_33360 [Pleurocapsa sp.]
MLSNNPNERDTKNYLPSENKPQNQIEFDWNEYVLKVKRRWKPALAIFLLTFGTTVFLSAFQKKNYQAEGKLLFKQNSTSALKDVLGEKVGTLEPLLNDQTPLSTQIEVITSEPVIQQVIDRLKLKDNEGEPLKPEDLEEKLTINLIGGSDVIQISYKDLDPKVSSDVVNTLMDVYLQEQIRSNQSDPATAKEFINKQLPQVETEVAEAESLLENFRTENSIIDLKTEKSALVGQIGQLNQEIAATGSQLQGIMAQTSSLQNQLGLNLKQAVAVNQLSNSPVVESLLTELTETESSLAKERQRFNDEHPTIISLEGKKQDLTQQLQQLIGQSVGQGVNVAQGLLQNDEMKENLLEKFITLKIEELSLQRQVNALYESQQGYLQRANH